MAKPDAAVLLAESEDQESVRNDLVIFVGQRSDYYLQKYEVMRQSTLKDKNFISWSWPVFLLEWSWFFYRKMYIVGAAMLLLPILMAVVFDFGAGGGGSVGLIFSMQANPMYLRHALKHIAKANTLGLQGEARADYLRRAGGTSKTAGALGLFIFLVAFSLAVLGVFAKKH